MVDDEAATLHEGVTNGRSDELEPELLQDFAHSFRFWANRRNALRILPFVELRAASDLRTGLPIIFTNSQLTRNHRHTLTTFFLNAK